MANEIIMNKMQNISTKRENVLPVLLVIFALVWTFAEQIRELFFGLYKFFGI